jgi:D-alanine--poly(phosphoribitol) ligase subunit 1
MDLLAQIDARALAAPRRIAHLSGGRQLTYGELKAQSDALAARLADLLPADRSPIAVLGHKEPELLVAFLAAVKAGHPYVPLDTSLPGARVAGIVERAGARLTLTPDRVRELWDVGPAAPPARLGPGDPFYVIFTSGSTGEPKGVVITLGCLSAFLGWLLEEQQFAGADEVFLNQAPFSFDLSVMDLYPCLATGGTLTSVSATEIAEPRRLFPLLAGSGISTWVSTPSFARFCLAEPSFGETMLPRLRRFLFCGETLPPAVAQQLLDRFPKAAVWNTYGPTEATVATTSVRIDRELLARDRPLPVGRPMAGTRVLVVDEAGREVAPGAKGEIVIAGPNVSPGYLGRPDLTERAFFRVDGVQAYRTGDLGRYSDGWLYFEGRRDHQVKLHGYRIELGDIEAHLLALRNVRDAVVVPLPDDGAPEFLAAFVIHAGGRPSLELEAAHQLRSQLGERVPAYMVPRVVRFMDAFPMTANGKADRRRLADLLA